MLCAVYIFWYVYDVMKMCDTYIAWLWCAYCMVFVLCGVYTTCQVYMVLGVCCVTCILSDVWCVYGLVCCMYVCFLMCGVFHCGMLDLQHSPEPLCCPSSLRAVGKAPQSSLPLLHPRTSWDIPPQPSMMWFLRVLSA